MSNTYDIKQLMSYITLLHLRKTIEATAKAFAALLGDGRVVTWGVERYGGSSDAVQELV